jgi:hypothetical protein
MQIRASGMGLFVSKEVAASVVLKVISKQRNKPNFGNVGAVNNLLDRGKERLMKRKSKNNSSVKKQNGCWVLLEEDLITMDKNIATTQIVYDDVDKNDDFVLVERENTSSIGSNNNSTFQNTAAKNSTTVLKASTAESTEKDVLVEATASDENQQVFAESFEEQKQEDEEAREDKNGDNNSPSAIWVLLEECCAEIGYTLEQLESFLKSSKYPQALKNLICLKSNQEDFEEVLPMLEPQRVEYLQRVTEAIRLIEAERQRQIEEERKRKNEAEKKAYLEKLKREQKIQERLRNIGVCPMSFAWIPTGGGYRCAGGSHFVNASQVNYID